MESEKQSPEIEISETPEQIEKRHRGERAGKPGEGYAEIFKEQPKKQKK